MLTLYVKPTCTTCRKAVRFLKDRKIPFDAVDLFETPPTAFKLKELCLKLGVAPEDLLRKKDPTYEALRLGSARRTATELLQLMSANPGLIQRPIAVKGKKAVVARPTERLRAVLS